MKPPSGANSIKSGLLNVKNTISRQVSRVSKKSSNRKRNEIINERDLENSIFTKREDESEKHFVQSISAQVYELYHNDAKLMAIINGSPLRY